MTKLSWKANFEIFGVNRVFDKKSRTSGNSQNLYFIRFAINWLLKIMVTVNVQPLSSPILFLVTTNFRANHVLTHVLKNCKEKNFDGNSKINALINAELGCAINMIIRLPVESWCDLEKVILSKFWVVYYPFNTYHCLWLSSVTNQRSALITESDK